MCGAVHVHVSSWGYSVRINTSKAQADQLPVEAPVLKLSPGENIRVCIFHQIPDAEILYLESGREQHHPIILASR